MPLINLIAEQRLVTRRAERRTRMAFIAFVASACAAVGSFGVLFAMSESAESEVARLNAEVRKLEPIRSETTANKQKLSELAPRLSTLEDAQALTDKWASILEHLSQYTPTSMWLTQLHATSTDPAKPINASFQGITGRLEPVGEFILRLQLCKNLETVNLKYAQEKVLASGRGIEFEVSADVAGTSETQPYKPKGDKASA